MRISDWSSDVCSSDLQAKRGLPVKCALIGSAANRKWAGGGIAKVERGYAAKDLLNAADVYQVRRAGGMLIVIADNEVQPVAIEGSRKLGLVRSEEHTSELQSLMRISYAVFCLKKKKKIKTTHKHALSLVTL